MGGAGIAAKQLHLALLEKGRNSTLVTKVKLGMDIPSHHYTGYNEEGSELSNFYFKNKKSGYDLFSFPFASLDIQEIDAVKQADIVHLHWISDFFVDYKKIFSLKNKKFIWTLHDANPFTGGCHVTDGCMKFTFNCNYCPQLEGTVDEYLSNKLLNYKLDALANIGERDMKIVTPSQWLGGLSGSSAALKRFEHSVIPNIINFSLNRPNRDHTRSKLKIKDNEIAFFFVANNVESIRKGADVLRMALQQISKKYEIRLILAGQSSGMYFNGINTLDLGFVKEKDILQEAYSVADAFLLPSLSENFPNSIIESFLCGTPVIASNVGGIPEQVNSSNGILAEAGNVDAWVSALSTFIVNRKGFERSSIAKDAEEKYNTDKVISKYLELYDSF